MTSLKIIFVYIGLTVGAGFASGREICEYFNFCSNSDYTGIILASFLFAIVCYIIIYKSYTYKLYGINDYIKSIFFHIDENSKIKYSEKAFLFLILLDLCAGFVVMLSSGGEILSNLFGFKKLFGSIILASLCFIVFIFDIKGVAYINLILVPIIIFILIIVCILSILNKIYSPAFFISDYFIKQNRNMLFLSVCYVSYNTLTASSVLSPMAKLINNKKTILTSSIISGAVIGLLIFLVWLAISFSFPSVWYASFPLEKLAGSLSEKLKYLYSICLIMSIFTTAVSDGCGILSYLKPKTRKSRALYSLIMIAVIFPFSMIGFSYLVKNLYSLMGMLGMIWMIIIIIDYFKDKRE